MNKMEHWMFMFEWTLNTHTFFHDLNFWLKHLLSEPVNKFACINAYWISLCAHIYKLFIINWISLQSVFWIHLALFCDRRSIKSIPDLFWGKSRYMVFLEERLCKMRKKNICHSYGVCLSIDDSGAAYHSVNVLKIQTGARQSLNGVRRWEKLFEFARVFKTNDCVYLHSTFFKIDYN